MRIATRIGLLQLPIGFCARDEQLCSRSNRNGPSEGLNGVAGVYLLTCPDRDCQFREGPKWLHERVHNDREAELKARVDRRRVRIGSFAVSEGAAIRRAVAEFRHDLEGLEPVVPERDAAVEAECKLPDAYAAMEEARRGQAAAEGAAGISGSRS